MWGRGTVLGGRYALSERLGSGAMGEVWRAEDQVLGRQVAVKIVLPALLEDEVFAARFRREATVLAAMNHRGVVHIHDYGEDGTDPDARTAYIVMELLTGKPLDRARGRTAFPPDRALDVAAQVLDALHAAHQQGIVHRDIKPSNLMIDADGRITVTDFGIARSLADSRITTSHAVIGTALYMAPERAEGKDASAVSDLYSVGVVLYELLAGAVPFTGGTPLEVVLKHVREPVPELPAEIPAPVRALVARALAKQPEDRHRDAAAMALAARQAMSTPAGFGAVLSAPEPVEPPPALPAPAPAASATPAVPPAPAVPESSPAPDKRAGRRRLATLILPVVLVGGGGVTAQQFDLLPWQHPDQQTTAGSAPSPGSPGGPATGPAAGAAPPSTAPGTTQADPTPPASAPATDQAGNPVPPGTDPGTGANPGTGNGGVSNPGGTTNSSGGSNPGTGSGSNPGSASGGGSSNSGSGSTPNQPKPTTPPATGSGPAKGCGGSGWGRLISVGSGQAIGPKADALVANMPVVGGGYSAYGWIRAVDSFGRTTFTACKADSGITLGGEYSGTGPRIVELAGSSNPGASIIYWTIADAGSGAFQVKFGYGIQTCLTDNGSGNTMTTETCTPDSESQLFRFS
ncbi:serine/threonine-protein kinase [Kitasatospora sp. YST-16]|uniref:serine/threonine-protein kinase n=1 Tax=Kitasatospora sp. YST-16 TaxID=2998080 RepID=UPI0022834C8D|nr:serine/threonine-protein kinase [Kitasatospora sp. YST-16]WAL71365.1 serine/threonine-protein kinase [Kitasatospora sp. YST-16]WNW37401.1 serine/threonine-protein kinase [Streptomyces sp. Li-HN-5-13]